MAIKNCVVLTCKNNSKDNPELRFFNLTTKPELRKLWLRNIGNTELHNITESRLKSKLVCQDHFHESQYRTSERIKLNLDAVPTLNLPNILNYTGQTIEDHDYLKRSTKLSSNFNDATENLDDVKNRIHNKNAQIRENKPIECDSTNSDDYQALLSMCDDMSENQKDKQKNFESILQLDLNQCRTCLSKINLKSIYDYADQLAEYASIYVHATDEFPKKICKVCIKKLKEISAFRKQCQNSEEAFSLTWKHHKRHIDSNIFLSMDTTEVTDIRKEDCVIDELIIFENKNNVEDDNIHVSIKTTNNITEDEDMKKYNQENLQNEEPIHFPKCHLCGKEFTVQSKYKYHMNAHNRRGEYLCHICGKPFTYLKALQIHTSIHKNISTIKCPVCPERVFEQSQDLHKHMKKDHEKKETYICSFCGCKYNKKRSFQKHIKNKHSTLNEDCTNNKLVSVEEKSANINVSKEQTENINNITEDQDMKPINASGKQVNLQNKCHLCGKQFLWRSKYKRHMNTHNKNICQICGRPFRSLKILERHIGIHNEINMINCPVCPDSVFI